jgi:hypothetical protein
MGDLGGLIQELSAFRHWSTLTKGSKSVGMGVCSVDPIQMVGTDAPHAAREP